MKHFFRIKILAVLQLCDELDKHIFLFLFSRSFVSVTKVKSFVKNNVMTKITVDLIKKTFTGEYPVDLTLF